MIKTNDETLLDIAYAMRRARKTTMIPRAHLAKLMNITIHQLGLYESGGEKMPISVLEQIFTMGYMMMYVRNLNRYYRAMAKTYIELFAYKQVAKKKI